MKKKILFVGKSDFSYNRDNVLIAGLENNPNVQISKLTISKRDWTTSRYIRKLSKDVDFVFVPSFRHRDLSFVKRASQAPVIFDPIISKYLTNISDYGQKWKAPYKYIVDWAIFRRADILLWDTEVHHDYIKKMYKLQQPSTHVHIGVNTDLFFPIEKKERVDDSILVGFYGSFNPLQGIDIIVKAAKLLERDPNIKFEIIGSGSTYKSVKKLAADIGATNINWIPRVPFDQLNEAINRFDICLGIFGKSKKADMVIPNKIFHYAGTKKPIITKETDGVLEIFNREGREEIMVIKNTPKELSQAILSLVNRREKRQKLSQAAYQLISQNYNQHKIAASFLNFLESYNHNG